MDRIDIRLEENVSAALAEAKRRVQDLTPAMQAIAVMMVSMTEENFDQERSPDGVPWKVSQRVKERGGKVLQDTGDLKGSIRPDWGATYAAAGPEASGGAAIYARIHQLGGTIKPRASRALNTPFGPRGSVTMPARPYLGYNEAMGRGILAAIQRHLIDASTGIEGGLNGGAPA